MSAQGCADLWREVLFQTICDALQGVKHQGGLNRENKIAMTYRARMYLTTPNRDFDLICTYAGIDPEAARERLAKLMASAPTPEQLIADRANAPRRKRGAAKAPGASSDFGHSEGTGHNSQGTMFHHHPMKANC